MYKLTSFIFLSAIGLCFGLPSPVLQKLAPSLRYQYATDSKGQDHLVDLWLTVDNVAEAARFDPVRTNAYHLFTRDNPIVSQPLILNNAGVLQSTNFRSMFLAAEDVNIIVVDWSVGASSINYRTVIANTISSGQAVAAFIDWVNQATASSGVQYHIVGHGFGGHQAGIIGRNVDGAVAYITALDPAFIGWVNHPDRFAPSDGQYTEVIHTNYGINGYLADLGHVDFYPNGGLSMPGCDSNACDHARSYFYFAESITSGGFTGRQCMNYVAAILGMCDILPGRLQMGGLRPKLGSSGVYLLETNAAPPFSLG